jgi:hypothetical protein
LACAAAEADADGAVIAQVSESLVGGAVAVVIGGVASLLAGGDDGGVAGGGGPVGGADELTWGFASALADGAVIAQVSERLVGGAVAVVIDAITSLRRRRAELGGAHDGPVSALAHRLALTGPDARAARGPVAQGELVEVSIAVVIEAIAQLSPRRAGLGITESRGAAGTTREFPGAHAHATVDGPQVFVGDAVTVVVAGVAHLRRALAGRDAPLGPVNAGEGAALTPAVQARVTHPAPSNSLVAGPITVIIEAVTDLQIGQVRRCAAHQLAGVIAAHLAIVSAGSDPREAGSPDPKALIEPPVAVVV